MAPDYTRRMQRISQLTAEQAQGDAREIMAGIEKKAGRANNFVRTIAHRPEVLKTLLPLYAAITGRGGVDGRIKEFAYMKASMINRCDYCLASHIASSKRHGVNEEQVRALAADYEKSPLFSAAEKQAIRYAEQVTRDANGVSDGDFDALKQHFSEEQIVEITLVVCMANFTNRLNDALRVPLDEGLSARV